jgi:alpha-L-fucosidase 2
LPKLFDNHPPFQIDGNFGALTAMTRMIVQSEIVDDGVVIDLFPSLPDSWRTGELKGGAIKGNLRMNLSWEDGRLKSALLFADPGTDYIEKAGLYFQGKYYEAPLTDGKLEIKNILPTTM